MITAERARWRGHITHIPSGDQHYLKNLGDIEAFISPYLEKMGVKFGLLRARAVYTENGNSKSNRSDLGPAGCRDHRNQFNEGGVRTDRINNPRASLRLHLFCLKHTPPNWHTSCARPSKPPPNSRSSGGWLIWPPLSSTYSRGFPMHEAIRVYQRPSLCSKTHGWCERRQALPLCRC